MSTTYLKGKAERNGSGTGILLNDLHFDSLGRLDGDRNGSGRLAIRQSRICPLRQLHQILRHISQDSHHEISPSVVGTPELLSVLDCDLLNPRYGAENGVAVGSPAKDIG